VTLAEYPLWCAIVFLGLIVNLIIHEMAHGVVAEITGGGRWRGGGLGPFTAGRSFRHHPGRGWYIYEKRVWTPHAFLRDYDRAGWARAAFALAGPLLSLAAGIAAALAADLPMPWKYPDNWLQILNEHPFAIGMVIYGVITSLNILPIRSGRRMWDGYIAWTGITRSFR